MEYWCWVECLVTFLFVSPWPPTMNSEPSSTSSSSTSPSLIFSFFYSVPPSQYSRHQSYDARGFPITTFFQDVTNTWIFGTFMCKIVVFIQVLNNIFVSRNINKFSIIQTVSMSVSVLTLTAISYDRYQGKTIQLLWHQLLQSWLILTIDICCCAPVVSSIQQSIYTHTVNYTIKYRMM